MSKPKRLPTLQEFEEILDYMEASFVHISDDEMHDMTQDYNKTVTQSLNTLMTDITGKPWEVSRYSGK
jgi:hypothetical protein